MESQAVLGIDVGGSGIKGALVDINTGKQLMDRFRIDMPNPSVPEAAAQVFADIATHFEWKGVIGCGFPAIIKNGVALSAANIDHSWIGVNAEKLFGEYTGCPVYVSNDADVAGVAEMAFGAGKGMNGVVIMITIGSGLGTAVFNKGVLLPNTELGHLYLSGMHKDAESYASNGAQKREHLSWKRWGMRFNEYLQHMAFLFSPDLIILGGGSSKYFDSFSRFITIDTKVVPATMFNSAGIVGAAVYGAKAAGLME